MTKRDALDYEVSRTWWAGWIGWGWGQELAARYFAWKSNRNWIRYELFIKRSKENEERRQKTNSSSEMKRTALREAINIIAPHK